MAYILKFFSSIYRGNLAGVSYQIPHCSSGVIGGKAGNHFKKNLEETQSSKMVDNLRSL